MLLNNKRMSSNDLHTGNMSEVSSSKSARLGAFALSLGALVILAALGFAPKAGARNADDDAAATSFKSNCVVCHGADGTGSPTGKALKAPDLHADAVQKLTNAEIVAQISDGKNNMPPFKNTLSKDQIAALAVYVHTAFGKKK
jgi:cytochrome c6